MPMNPILTLSLAPLRLPVKMEEVRAAAPAALRKSLRPVDACAMLIVVSGFSDPDIPRRELFGLVTPLATADPAGSLDVLPEFPTFRAPHRELCGRWHGLPSRARRPPRSQSRQSAPCPSRATARQSPRRVAGRPLIRLPVFPRSCWGRQPAGKLGDGLERSGEHNAEPQTR